MERLVRDVFRVNGLVEREAGGRIRRIVLNQAHPYAPQLFLALPVLVPVEQVALSLGETLGNLGQNATRDCRRVSSIQRRSGLCLKVAYKLRL